MLTEFLGREADPADVWAQVDANFKAGRIKLLFVADRIPRELARIVEFLDAQMSADVRAVELRYFQGEQGTRTLAPRSVGGTKRPPEPITEEQWFAQNIVGRDPKTVEGARFLREYMRRMGTTSGVTVAQGRRVRSTSQ